VEQIKATLAFAAHLPKHACVTEWSDLDTDIVPWLIFLMHPLKVMLTEAQSGGEYEAG